MKFSLNIVLKYIVNSGIVFYLIMSEDYSAGHYTVHKRFRNEEEVRHQKDIPWRKQILDLDNNKFFSRTPWAWLRIILFYMFLYFCLTIIVSTYFLFFYFFVFPVDQPLILKKFPGISSVPSSSRTITFRPDIHNEVYEIADAIDRFIEDLDDYGAAEDIFEDCNGDQLWGYNAKEPCVFVKINRIIGYVPETYDSIKELPDGYPHLLNTTMTVHAGIGRIWITCEFLNAGKKSPHFEYIPKPYFDTQVDFSGVNRVVAVKLKNMPYNVDVEFMCRVWAKNIPIDEKIHGRGNIKLTMNMHVY